MRTLSADWLSAFGTLVSAGASVVLAYFTIQLVALTKELARETRLTREARSHADVQLSVEPHRAHVNVLEIVIANVGQGTARDVSLSIEGDAVRKAGGTTHQKSLRLASMLPGSQHRVFLGVIAGLPATADVRAIGSFRDTRGRREIEVRQEVGGWFGFTRLGNDPQAAATSALESIAKTLSHWDGFRRLHVDVFTNQDRQREDKEREAWLKEQTRPGSEGLGQDGGTSAP